MEEVNPSPSDTEQPHAPVNHSRPFFYVQPPSQPYFMYQWPMEPFGQYGFPGPVFPFGRPYMSPYQYVQYPGYVVPHAPMQPTEYRRVAPFLPSVGSFDLRFRQHFQQMSMHREMTSAEAQTESVDQVVRLMDSLSRLQTCEKSGNTKEQNMLSSTPDVTSCPDVENLHLESQPEQGDSTKPSTLCDSAVSSQGRLEECVLSDVLPLDSSSVHEENQDKGDQRGPVELSYFERMKGTALTGDILGHEGSTEGHDSGAPVSDLDEKSDACGDQITSQDEQVENLLLDSVEVIEPLVQNTDYDLPYQILHLPCDKATTGLLFHKASPIMSMDPSSALLPSKSYSFGSTCLYSYYPQVAPERQSVLSPSLDELSSKDEMFSTDVEDDLTSGQVHITEDKLETSFVPTGLEKEHKDEACSVCACCGASLLDEDENGRLPENCGYLEKELAQDCECDDLEEASPSNGGTQQQVTRHQGSRQTLPPCGQQAGKHKARKTQGVELAGPYQGHARGECGEQFHAPLKTERAKGKGQRSAQSRYSESFHRDGPGELLDQENWASTNGKHKSKSCRPNNGLQEQGRPARRRSSCKTFAPQRSRRNEYDDHDEGEFSYCHRGRGMMRRGARY